MERNLIQRFIQEPRILGPFQISSLKRQGSAQLAQAIYV